jgi:hypothetical protein
MPPMMDDVDRVGRKMQRCRDGEADGIGYSEQKAVDETEPECRCFCFKEAIVK